MLTLRKRYSSVRSGRGRTISRTISQGYSDADSTIGNNPWEDTPARTRTGTNGNTRQRPTRLSFDAASGVIMLPEDANWLMEDVTSSDEDEDEDGEGGGEQSEVDYGVEYARGRDGEGGIEDGEGQGEGERTPTEEMPGNTIGRNNNKRASLGSLGLGLRIPSNAVGSTSQGSNIDLDADASGGGPSASTSTNTGIGGTGSTTTTPSKRHGTYFHHPERSRRRSGVSASANASSTGTLAFPKK